MTDYISRSAFKEEVRRLSTHYLNEWSTLGVLAAVDRIPAADVQEVKMGKWLYDNDMNTGIYAICSCCRESIYQSFEFFYCPVCGARMEREEQT